LSPTSPTDLISLFMLGFLGTGHCIGMCGPLVVALPGQFDNWRAHLIYNLGRLATYSTVGGLLGLAGSGLSRIAIQQAASPMAWIARVQVGISIFSAAFLLLFGLTRLGLLREPRWMASAAPQRIPGYRSASGAYLTEKPFGGFWSWA
jgi:sulfite exporter TauE/SafE